MLRNVMKRVVVACVALVFPDMYYNQVSNLIMPNHSKLTKRVIVSNLSAPAADQIHLVFF